MKTKVKIAKKKRQHNYMIVLHWSTFMYKFRYTSGSKCMIFRAGTTKILKFRPAQTPTMRNIYTGLFKMFVGDLTTCHKQYI